MAKVNVTAKIIKMLLKTPNHGETCWLKASHEMYAPQDNIKRIDNKVPTKKASVAIFPVDAEADNPLSIENIVSAKRIIAAIGNSGLDINFAYIPFSMFPIA